MAQTQKTVGSVPTSISSHFRNSPRLKNKNHFESSTTGITLIQESIFFLDWLSYNSVLSVFGFLLLVYSSFGSTFLEKMSFPFASCACDSLNFVILYGAKLPN